MIFTNGTWVEPVAGVVEVEFWNEMVHRGRCVVNQSTKCSWTLVEPGVPGTRGMRMGLRMEPLFMSKSEPAAGRLRRVSSERGVYAATRERSAQSRRWRICGRRDAISLN